MKEAKNSNNDHIKFIHSQQPSGGVITVALKPTGTIDLHKMGVAFCSPEDQWDRKKARTIAVGRIQTRGITCRTRKDDEDLYMTVSRELNHRLLVNNAWTQYLQKNNRLKIRKFPRWARTGIVINGDPHAYENRS